MNREETNKKNKLYFLIDSDLHTYFFENELKHMLKRYDVTVLSANEITGNINIEGLDIKRVDNNFRTISERIKAVLYMVTDVTLYKETLDILKSKGQKIARIKDSLAFYIQSEKYYAGLKRDDLIDKNGKGIIYCYWYNFTPLAIVNHKRFKNYRTFTRTHGYELYDIRNEFRRQPFKMLMDKHLEKVVFACEYAKDYYLDRYNLKDSEKYPVCPLGTLDNRLVRQEEYISIDKLDGSKTPEYTIVSCSDMVPLKRVDLVVKGLANIDDINVRWVHFGSGVEEEKIKHLVKKLLDGKDNIKVEFRGRVKNKVLHDFYNETPVGLFITTTFSEGGNPVSIMEAMSYGIPIIATNICNIPKMIDNNGVILSENPNGDEIAAAIKSVLLATAKEKEQMRLRSRKIWEEKYNSDVNSERFIENVLMTL